MARHGDKDREGGFTLIEVLVVVVILAILSTIVTMAVTGLSDKGNTTAVKADVKTLRTAEEAYYAQRPDANRVYATEQELEASKFVAQQSSLHDVCLSTNKKAYVVVPAGTDCSTVTFS